ncbi:MAG: hypothetical protein KME26_20645 [Oscillatoria princeps RMCB-10]|jgi:hypothetical protein|nr:hypothetical protein [Oscillatoria princeps RMCB-10]
MGSWASLSPAEPELAAGLGRAGRNCSRCWMIAINCFSGKAKGCTPIWQLYLTLMEFNESRAGTLALQQCATARQAGTHRHP